MDTVDFMNNRKVVPDDIKLLRIPLNKDDDFIMPIMYLKNLPYTLDKEIQPKFIKVGEKFEESD